MQCLFGCRHDKVKISLQRATADTEGGGEQIYSFTP